MLIGQSHLKSEMAFDFGNSPLSPEWRDKISKTLNDMSDVFAQHDLDFGRTSKVKHRIKLSDKTVFKQRERPIHLNDLAAVQRHLQELKESGQIRESESPFTYVWTTESWIHKLWKIPMLCPTFKSFFLALSGSQWFNGNLVTTR